MNLSFFFGWFVVSSFGEPAGLAGSTLKTDLSLFILVCMWDYGDEECTYLTLKVQNENSVARFLLGPSDWEGLDPAFLAQNSAAIFCPRLVFKINPEIFFFCMNAAILVCVLAGCQAGLFPKNNGWITKDLKGGWQTISHDGPRQEGGVRSSSFLHFYKVICVDSFVSYVTWLQNNRPRVRLKQTSTTGTVLATLLGFFSSSFHFFFLIYLKRKMFLN